VTDTLSDYVIQKSFANIAYVQLQYLEDALPQRWASQTSHTLYRNATCKA